MTALLVTIFIASVAGGLHCVGMCGAFLGVAVANVGDRPASKAGLHAGYHLGRLVSYAILGAVAGAVGSSVNMAGAIAGVERPAAILAGAVLLLFGVRSLLGAMGVRLGAAAAPQWLLDLSVAAHRGVFSLPPYARAVSVGLLTTLLPCAWLWAFVFAAAGTGSAMTGMLAMAAFWAGTLPLLGAFGFGLDAVLRRAGKAVPILTSVALIAVGAWTMTHRLRAPFTLTALAEKAAVVRLSGTPNLPDQSELPCCHK